MTRSPKLPPMLAALARATSPTGAAALDPCVPSALWRRALVGPAAEFLARPGKALRTTIVRAGWLLGGGTGEPPETLGLAIELLHAGSLIIDDVEDGSDERRGAPALHRLVGEPLAINTGSWLYFWALAELSEVAPEAVSIAVKTLVRCHQGQALDLATVIADVDLAHVPSVVGAITELKTGALCRLGCELGALAAGASPEVRDAVGRFGEAMGCALQMLDDLGSLVVAERRAKGHEDLRNARATWPWAWLAETCETTWARLVAHPRSTTEELDALAMALGEAVADVGRARARATYEQALADLVGAVGPSPVIEGLAAELRRMEDAYV